MNSGYFTISRKIKDNFLYPLNENRKFTNFEAWFYLLEKAYFACREKFIDGKLITVPRGYLDTTVEQLSVVFKWDRRTTEKFLKLLENQEQIKRFKTSKSRKACTLIKINNYNAFQPIIADNCTSKCKTKCKLYCKLQCQTECTPNNKGNNVNKEKKKIIDPFCSKEVTKFIEMYKPINRVGTAKHRQLIAKALEAEPDFNVWLEVINKSKGKGHKIDGTFMPISLENLLNNYHKILEDSYNLVEGVASTNEQRYSL